MRFRFLLVASIACLEACTKVAFIPAYASDHGRPMTNYCHKIQVQLRDYLKSKPGLNERNASADHTVLRLTLLAACFLCSSRAFIPKLFRPF